MGKVILASMLMASPPVEEGIVLMERPQAPLTFLTEQTALITFLQEVRGKVDHLLAPPVVSPPPQQQKNTSSELMVVSPKGVSYRKLREMFERDIDLQKCLRLALDTYRRFGLTNELMERRIIASEDDLRWQFENCSIPESAAKVAKEQLDYGERLVPIFIPPLHIGKFDIQHLWQALFVNNGLATASVDHTGTIIQNYTIKEMGNLRRLPDRDTWQDLINDKPSDQLRMFWQALYRVTEPRKMKGVMGDRSEAHIAFVSPSFFPQTSVVQDLKTSTKEKKPIDPATHFLWLAQQIYQGAKARAERQNKDIDTRSPYMFRDFTKRAMSRRFVAKHLHLGAMRTRYSSFIYPNGMIPCLQWDQHAKLFSITTCLPDSHEDVGSFQMIC